MSWVWMASTTRPLSSKDAELKQLLKVDKSERPTCTCPEKVCLIKFTQWCHACRSYAHQACVYGGVTHEVPTWRAPSLSQMHVSFTAARLLWCPAPPHGGKGTLFTPFLEVGLLDRVAH